MEIELLKTFRTVAHLGSISKTADEMYLSVSSVTSRIKTLESQLGVDLFQRTGRRLDISKDGTCFLEYVERFLTILEEGQNKITQTNEENSGVINIAVSSNIANYMLPALIRAFREEYPQISIQVYLSSNYKLIDRISNGHMELGITNHVVNEGGLISQLWFRDKIIPVMPENHSLAKKKILQPHHLKDFPLIGYPSHKRKSEIINKWFKSAQITPRFVIDVNEVGLIKKLLVEMDAMAFLPYLSVKTELLTGKFITVPPSPLLPERDIVFVHKKNLDLSHATKLFIHYAKSYYFKQIEEEAEALKWNYSS